MKALTIITVLMSLNSYASELAFKEVETSLSYQDLENEIFYNVEDVKVKDIKYIKSFDNQLIVPTLTKDTDIRIKDLSFSENIDTVILKSHLGEKVEIPQDSAFKISMVGGEGGT